MNITIDAWVLFGFLAQFVFFSAVCCAVVGIGKGKKERYTAVFLVPQYRGLGDDTDICHQAGRYRLYYCAVSRTVYICP